MQEQQTADRSVHVLIITGDPIGRRVAGPAIRAWNMATAASGVGVVRLLSLSGIEDGFDAPFDLAHVPMGDERAFAPHERWADVIVFQGHAMAAFETLRLTDKIVVADVYDPMQLEALEQGRALPRQEWRDGVAEAVAVLNEQLSRGDFFLAASERQRAFWLGQLAALGRVNPDNYIEDPFLSRLLAVVPFGLPDGEPRHERAAVKGVIPGIGADDKLLIWAGGIYDWFDPELLVRAVAVLSRDHPEVKLLFMGTQHPHPEVPVMPIVAATRNLAEQLGVLGTAVFFNDSWVDFGDRQNYLTEANAGVSTHLWHIETTFSFRTRILDYLWAGLPMVVSRGDHFGDLVDEQELGVAVPPGDLDALVAGLERVLFDPDFAPLARENIRRIRDDYRWSVVLEPFVDFLRRPRPAPDRSAGLVPPPAQPAVRGPGLHRIGLTRIVQRARREGLAGIVRLVRRRLATRG